LGGLVAVATVFVCFALLARFVVHGEVTPRSLHDALTAEAPSAGEILGEKGTCKRTRPRVWTCAITDSAGSGGAEYRVTVRRNSSCWDARLRIDGSEGGMPKKVSGCVHLWQWSLFDLV
jgi:hypothetical protein